jgi:hypothetical protein
MSLTTSRVQLMLALLLGALGLLLDQPWSLALAGAALGVLGALVTTWFVVDEHRVRIDASNVVGLEEADDFRFVLPDAEDPDAWTEYWPPEPQSAKPRLTDRVRQRMRLRASRNAPASLRIRAPKPSQLFRSAFAPPESADLLSFADDEARVEGIADHLSRRMRWDALWWFVAAVAVSIPVGIFVNHIS